MSSKKGPGGAPSKYRKIYAQQVLEHVMNGWREGATFRKWGLDRNILPSTLHEWADVHQEFSDARNLCKQYEKEYWIDLLRKASTGNGDDVTETTTEIDLKDIGPGGKPRPVKQYVHKKKAKMSTAAIMFALKNLFPEEWKEIVNNVVDTSVFESKKVEIEFVDPKP